MVPFGPPVSEEKMKGLWKKDLWQTPGDDKSSYDLCMGELKISTIANGNVMSFPLNQANKTNNRYLEGLVS